jgi:uncharacterized protein (DUF1501 family)
MNHSLHMSRRRLLMAGGALGVATLMAPRLRAQGTPPPFVITIEALAAWDPTTHVDPHAHPSFSPYSDTDIIRHGALRVAPRFDGVNGGTVRGPHRVTRMVGGAAQQVDFWQQHAGKMRVFNGVNNKTAIHEAGRRFAFTGNLREGSPSLGALMGHAAQLRTPSMALPFISNGGTDLTGGLLAVSRMPNISVLQRMAAPSVLNFTTGARSVSSSNALALQAAHQANDTALLQAAVSRPAFARELRNVCNGRAAQASFEALAARVEARVVPVDTPLVEAAAAVLTAMGQAGDVSAAGHLSMGSFDTHADHDDLHPAKLNELLQGIDYIIHEIETAPDLDIMRARGVLLYIASDFARTRYNAADDDADAAVRGKDHWPVTSSIVVGLGAASSLVQPGVVGETRVQAGNVVLPGTEAKPMRINGGRLQTVAFGTALSDSVFALNAGDVMTGLRAAALGSDDTDAFPLLETNAVVASAVSTGNNLILRDD